MSYGHSMIQSASKRPLDLAACRKVAAANKWPAFTVEFISARTAHVRGVPAGTPDSYPA